MLTPSLWRVVYTRGPTLPNTSTYKVFHKCSMPQAIAIWPQNITHRLITIGEGDTFVPQYPVDLSDHSATVCRSYKGYLHSKKDSYRHRIPGGGVDDHEVLIENRPWWMDCFVLSHRDQAWYHCVTSTSEPVHYRLPLDMLTPVDMTALGEWRFSSSVWGNPGFLVVSQNRYMEYITSWGMKRLYLLFMAYIIVFTILINITLS